MLSSTFYGDCFFKPTGDPSLLALRKGRFQVLQPSFTGGNAVTLPDARTFRQIGGPVCTLVNPSGTAVTLKDSTAGTVGTIAASKAVQVYLLDNTTQAGRWQLVSRTLNSTRTFADSGGRSVAIGIDPAPLVAPVPNDLTDPCAASPTTYDPCTNGALDPFDATCQNIYNFTLNAGSLFNPSVDCVLNTGFLTINSGRVNGWTCFYAGGPVSYAVLSLYCDSTIPGYWILGVYWPGGTAVSLFRLAKSTGSLCPEAGVYTYFGSGGGGFEGNNFSDSTFTIS